MTILNDADHSFLEEEISPIEENLYEEFSKFVEECDEWLPAMNDYERYVEGKVDYGVKGTVNRTKEITGNVVKAYGDITKGGGDIIYHSMSVGMKLLSIASKAIRFVCGMVAKVPANVNDTMTKIGNTSRAFIHSLKGQMDIYLTVDSLKYFETEILGEITKFITAANKFSSGDGWTSLWSFTDEKGNRELLGHKSENIMGALKAMKKYSARLTRIGYEPTTIDVESPIGQDSYLNSESDYFTDIKRINETMTGQLKTLRELEGRIRDKIKRTENRDAFWKNSGSKRDTIYESMNVISKCMVSVGKFYDYLKKDIKTINAAIEKDNVNRISKKKGIDVSKVKD